MMAVNKNRSSFWQFYM